MIRSPNIEFYKHHRYICTPLQQKIQIKLSMQHNHNQTKMYNLNGAAHFLIPISEYKPWNVRKKKENEEQKSDELIKLDKKKKHNCPHCKCSFKKNETKKVKPKPFVCAYGNCRKRITHKYRLENHMKFHLGIKAHQCLYCTKAFVIKVNLTQHIRVCTGM